MNEETLVTKSIGIAGLTAVLVILGILELVTGIFFGYMYSQMPLAIALQQGLSMIGVSDFLPLVAAVIVIVALVFFASAYGIYSKRNWGSTLGMIVTVIGVFIAGFVSSLSNLVNQSASYYLSTGGLVSPLYFLDSLQGPAIYVNIIGFLAITILLRVFQQHETSDAQ